MLPYTYVSYFSAKDAITRKEKCLEKLERLKEQYRVTAAGNVKADMPFGDWMDFWYQQYEKQRIRPTTQAHYENLIYKHVIPEI